MHSSWKSLAVIIIIIHQISHFPQSATSSMVLTYIINILTLTSDSKDIVESTYTTLELCNIPNK